MKIDFEKGTTSLHARPQFTLVQHDNRKPLEESICSGSQHPENIDFSFYLSKLHSRGKVAAPFRKAPPHPLTGWSSHTHPVSRVLHSFY
jgi:hypothetical protein